MLFQFDLLHIDDCVEAFLLTIEYLTRSLNSNSFYASRTSFHAFDIASGDLTSVESLIESLVTLTSSKSPVRRIPQGGHIASSYRGSIGKAWTVLGFRASVGTNEGLLRLVKAHLRQTETFLRGRIEATCGKASPSITINSNLDKLDDCWIHIQVNVQGDFQTLVPPGGGTGEDRDPQEVWSTDSDVQSLEAIIYRSKGQAKERQAYSIKSSFDERWLGVMRADPGPVQLPGLRADDISGIDPMPIVEWELELNPEDHTAVRLVIPGTDLYLMSPTIVRGDFTIVSKKTKDEWPFRITPICCKAPGPWPFFRDDREFFVCLTTFSPH